MLRVCPRPEFNNLQQNVKNAQMLVTAPDFHTNGDVKNAEIAYLFKILPQIINSQKDVKPTHIRRRMFYSAPRVKP